MPALSRSLTARNSGSSPWKKPTTSRRVVSFSGDAVSGRSPSEESFCGFVFNARSEEHTSELQSLMRISYAVFCLKKKKKHIEHRLKQTRYNYDFEERHYK